MNILVTGGAGYVGYSVTRALARQYPQSKVIIFDNFLKGRLENIALIQRYPNVVIVPWEKADIRDVQNVEAVLDEFRPEVVVHLAAIVDAFSTNREGKDIETNIVNNISAVRLAELGKQYGVKTFIFQSTVSLYSRGADLTEDAPKEPLSVYGKSKLEAERAILNLDDADFNACALRSATMVGYNPSFRYETIINMLCIRSVYGMQTTLFESALENPKSYLSLDDEAAAILFAIENIRVMKGEAFNVVSFNTDLNEVVAAIAETGVTPQVHIATEKTINQQVYTVNADKIRRLGFTPTGTVRDVVHNMIEGIHIREYSSDGIVNKLKRKISNAFRLPSRNQ
ncbi:MAG: NAD(P)-dependent oxidoreductase [Candidatus Paceibacterota bacterium]|jgi:nucleoside-diphosphate-sugar epimerase